MLKKIKNNLVLQKILSAILVLVWMITVFIFSSQDGIETLNTSGAFINAIENTSQVISQSNNQTDKENTQEKKEYKYMYSKEVQKIVRKNAHFFLYMVGGIILSVFFYAFLRKSNIKENTVEKSLTKLNTICKKYMYYAVVFGIMYSLTDEFHQRFVPGRTSSIKDVFIDSSGVITGVLLFTIFKIILTKRKKIKAGE